MTRTEDAADLVEILQAGGKALYDLLPTDSWSTLDFQRKGYDRKIRYTSLALPQNRMVYLEDMAPAQAIGTELLPPYLFHYHYAISEEPGKVWLVGTLAKRSPDQVDWDKINSLKLFVPDDTVFANSALNAQANYALNGTDYIAPNCWGGGQSISQVEFAAEIPLSSTNEVNFALRLEYGDSRSVQTGHQEFSHYERVPMFTLANPGDVYIADQLRAQCLEGKSTEVQATWKLNLALRTYATAVPTENEVTIWDNGTAVKRITLSQGRVSFDGSPYTYGHAVKETADRNDFGEEDREKPPGAKL